MSQNDSSYPPEQEQAILLGLMNQARQQPKRSRKQRKLLNQMIFVIQRSPRLYRAKDILRGKSQAEYDDIYGEALQRALTEIASKLMDYDENQKTVMGWVKFYISMRTYDVLREIKKKRDREKPLLPGTDHPPSKGQDINAAKMLINCLRQKIETNQQKLCDIGMTYKGYKTDINAYNLLVFLLPLEFDPKSLSALAEENGIEPKPVKRFYRDRCRSHLQKYTIECGWEPPLA